MKLSLRLLILSVLMIATGLISHAVIIVPSEKYVIKKITSDDFDAVRTTSSIDIIYTVGPRNIEVYAPDNLISYIRVVQVGSEIRVGYTENISLNIKGKNRTCVRISAPDVNRFTTTSSGDILIQDNLSQKNGTIEMHTKSSGDIKAMSVKAAAVKLTTSSSGDIVLAGDINAGEVYLTVSSSGDIKVDKIAAKQNVSITTNSSGDISITEVTAGSRLMASAGSAGDIKILKVSAEMAVFETNSSGDIRVQSVEAENVSCSARSAGDMVIAGNCRKLNLVSSSSGDINAVELVADIVNATANSSGDIVCSPRKALYATTNGIGEIKYKGNPSEIRKGGVETENIRRF